MMPMTLLAYDQNSRFSDYSGVLPVTKEQIVGGKYIIGLCGMVLAELLRRRSAGGGKPALDSCDDALLWFRRWFR